MSPCNTTTIGEFISPNSFGNDDGRVQLNCQIIMLMEGFKTDITYCCQNFTIFKNKESHSTF